MSEMNTYKILLTKGGPETINAYSYTKDEEEKRYIFHQKEDLSDDESFYSMDLVTSIQKVVEKSTLVERIRRASSEKK